MLLGVLFMLLSCLCLAMMGVFVKAASVYATSYFILFLQFLVSFLLLLIFMFQQHLWEIKTGCLKIHMFRAVTGTLAAYGLFFAIKLIPLTSAVLLVYSAPLWMLVFAWMFLKEEVLCLSWIGVLIGFIGIGLVLHPRIDTIHLGTIAALLGGILMSMALLSVRLLNKTEPTFRILFYYLGFATLFSLPFFFYTLLHWKGLPLITWVNILGVGLMQILSQAFIVIAYRYATPAKLAPYIYFVIVFTAILNYIIWKESLNLWHILGMSLVVIGGFISMYSPKINTYPNR